MQDLTGKIPGSQLTAAEWNQLPEEVQTVITNSGQALSGATLDQLAKAITGLVANGTFYTESGAVNVYVLTNIDLQEAPIAYTNGFRIDFRVTTINTGASTIDVAGLGAQDLKDDLGNPLIGGELSTTVINTAIYDIGTTEFRLQGVVTSKSVFTTSDQSIASSTASQPIPEFENQIVLAANSIYRWNMHWVITRSGTNASFTNVTIDFNVSANVTMLVDALTYTGQSIKPLDSNQGSNTLNSGLLTFQTGTPGGNDESSYITVTGIIYNPSVSLVTMDTANFAAGAVVTGNTTLQKGSYMKFERIGFIS